ncbi:hypothetical protein ADK38_22730, partial [Streptomyces varsoviensis]
MVAARPLQEGEPLAVQDVLDPAGRGRTGGGGGGERGPVDLLGGVADPADDRAVLEGAQPLQGEYPARVGDGDDDIAVQRHQPVARVDGPQRGHRGDLGDLDAAVAAPRVVGDRASGDAVAHHQHALARELDSRVEHAEERGLARAVRRLDRGLEGGGGDGEQRERQR